MRPKHFDGTKTHPFCSKTCANKRPCGIGSGSNAPSGATASAGDCDVR